MVLIFFHGGRHWSRPHMTATASRGLTFISPINSVTKPVWPRQPGVGLSTVKITSTPNFCQRLTLFLIKNIIGGDCSVSKVKPAKIFTIFDEIFYQAGNRRDTATTADHHDILAFKKVQRKTIAVRTANGDFIAFLQRMKSRRNRAPLSDYQIKILFLVRRGSGAKRRFSVAPQAGQNKLAWNKVQAFLNAII